MPTTTTMHIEDALLWSAGVSNSGIGAKQLDDRLSRLERVTAIQYKHLSEMTRIHKELFLAVKTLSHGFNMQTQIVIREKLSHLEVLETSVSRAFAGDIEALERLVQPKERSLLDRIRGVFGGK